MALHIIPSEFVAWNREGDVPTAVRATAVDKEALNFPLGMLFLALLYLQDANYAKAASFVVKALQTGDDAVRKHKCIRICLELCAEDNFDLATSLNDDDVVSRLEDTLEQDARTDGDDEVTRKRSRLDSAATTAPADDVDSSLRVYRVYHAAAVLRKRLLAYFKEKSIACRTASPLIVIQKLLFYTDACHISKYGAPLFGLPPTALQTGPAYDHAKAFLYSLHQSKMPTSWEPPMELRALSDEQVGLLNLVFDRMVMLPAERLVELTHEEQPWLDAKQRAEASRAGSEPIDLEAMCRWFSADNSRVVRYLLNTDPSAVLEALLSTPTQASAAAAAESS